MTSSEQLQKDIEEYPHGLSITSFPPHFDVVHYPTGPPTPVELGKWRGTITLRGSSTIVVPSLGYVPELVDPSIILESDPEQWLCLPCREGTLLRLFHFEGTWYLATYRKPDSRMSRWGGSLSFHEQFCQWIQRKVDPFDFSSFCQDHFSVDFIYYFFLNSTSQTRIVLPAIFTSSSPFEEGGYLVGVYERDPKGKGVVGSFRYGMDPTIPCPEWIPRIQPFSTTPPASEWMISMDYKRFQGLLWMNRQCPQVQYKWVHPQCKKWLLIRGSHPDVCVRYLELRSSLYVPNATIEDKKNALFFLQTLIRLFPDRRQEFVYMEIQLFTIAKSMLSYYDQKYLYHQFPLPLPPIRYRCLRERIIPAVPATTGGDQERRSSRRCFSLTLATVFQTVNQLSPWELYRLLQEMSPSLFSPLVPRTESIKK